VVKFVTAVPDRIYICARDRVLRVYSRTPVQSTVYNPVVFTCDPSSLYRVAVARARVCGQAQEVVVRHAHMELFIFARSKRL